MGELDPTTLWSRVLEALSGRIAARTIDTLLRPLEPMDATRDRLGGVFLLKAPNEFQRDWVARSYGPLIEEQLKVVAGEPFALHWTIPTPVPAAPAAKGPATRKVVASPAPARKPAAARTAQVSATNGPAAASAQSSLASPSVNAQGGARGDAPPAMRTASEGQPGARPQPAIPPTFGIAQGLHPKYTFDNFVIGPSNQLAHAAALAMSQPVGRRFNPLFLYGPTGLGKTHLINAVGHAILAHKPDAQIVYVSAEHFTNEFIGALHSHAMDKFRARYRGACDALLIDDVQFLSGRDQTQEEFFHTFNALHMRDRPIVITSDVAPAQLKGMAERLVSRFGSGLVADIYPPEMEVRVAILRKKAELENIHVDDEAAFALAGAVASNVRELEGLLMKLAIKASLAGKPCVDMTIVREALRLPTRAAVTTVEDIQRAVCDHYRVKLAQLTGRDRHQEIALPRQVAMYLCRERLGTSFPQLGAKFGGKDHTTVISAVNKIKKLIAEDHAIKQDLEAIVSRLGVSSPARMAEAGR